jgi:cytoskeletal protein CcmA (bactofilin family)
MNIEDFKSSRFNIIGRSTKISGDLVVDGKCIIHGEITGNIRVSDSSALVIEKTGKIHGTITGDQVENHGEIIGEINIQGLLSLRPGSYTEGKIESGKLVVYPGAIVNSEADVD